MTYESQIQLEGHSPLEVANENRAIFEDAYSGAFGISDRALHLNLYAANEETLRDVFKDGGRLIIDGPGFELDLNVKVEGNSIKIQDFKKRDQFMDFAPLLNSLKNVPGVEARFVKNEIA